MIDWDISYNDLVEVAWKLYDQGDFPDALHIWKLIHKLFPNEPEPYRGSALAHKKIGDYASADSALCEGLKQHPHNRQLLGDYANLAQEQKNWTKALERWAEYRDKFPTDPLGHFPIMWVERQR